MSASDDHERDEDAGSAVTLAEPLSGATTVAPGARSPEAELSTGPTVGPDTPPPETPPGTKRETPRGRQSGPTIRPPERPSLKDDRYVLGEEIARGGMGRVVEATDTLLGRRVAVKEALITDGDFHARFERETRITARLEHPSIVPVYDAGTTPDGSPFYVMRRVSGQPLEDLVLAAKTLDQRLALLPHLLAAANAIAHAHSRGVLHRDLKPSNILVGALGETVVIDWGLAKVADEPDDPADSISRLASEDAVRTRIGSVVGTPGFMPPEQLRGEKVDARTDVYALGATLYFLLARRAPHAAKTGDEMMQAALAGPPTPIREVVPGVPAELSTIVDKALAYAHDARYQDAGGLAEDLDRFLKGQLVASHRYSRRERFVRFWRRHRLSISIAAAAVVALAVGGWIAIDRVVGARDRADASLAQAIERNEALELERARALLATSPTTAIALVRPLAAKYWREAGAIAMAARAAGVAHGLPGSRLTLSLELSHDGKRALSAGGDGVLRVYELATRNTQVIAELRQRAHAVWSSDDKAAVAWTARELMTIDLATGARRTVPVEREPVVLRTAGGSVWWTDGNGAAWTYDVADTAARRVEVDDKLRGIEIREDAVAFAGERHLWILRRGTPTPVAAGAVKAIAWSPDGRLAALIDERLLELNADDRVVHDDWRPQGISLAWVDGVLHVGETGLIIRPGEMPLIIRGEVQRLLPGPGGSVVVRNGSNGIVLVEHEVFVEIPPTAAIGALAASPASHFLVAGSDGVVLVWDLDDLLPRREVTGNGSHLAAYANGQLLVVRDDHTATWIELVTGTRTPLVLRSDVQGIRLAADGGRGVICEIDGRCVLYTRGSAEGVELDAPAKMVAFAGDKLAMGAASGEVRLFDPATRRSTLLGKGTAGAWDILVRGTWVGVIFDDNSLWRHDLATGATLTMPASDNDQFMRLRDGGTALVTDPSRLRTWTAIGELVDGPALPPPVAGIHEVDDDHVVVRTAGDSGYLVELSGARRATMVYPPGSRLNELNFRGDLGTFIDQSDSINVTAPFAGLSWQVGRPTGAPLRWPALSEDRTTVYAFGSGALFVWKQPVPATQADVMRLIDGLTNAHLDDAERARAASGAPGALQWAW